jgi:tetratricopeptide (TPR) repeat protein
MISKVTYTLMLMSGLAVVVFSQIKANWGYDAITRIAILILSFIATALAAYISFVNPVTKWQQLRMAALSIESNIWTFRTRSGIYRTSGEEFDHSAEETLADALHRRAQAKLFLDSHKSILLEALEDINRATSIDPENDNYALVCAACNMRLNRFEDAARFLEGILSRSPNNEKALYQYAYCQRSIGKRTDAIEGLTKVIFEEGKKRFFLIYFLR